MVRDVLDYDVMIFGILYELTYLAPTVAPPILGALFFGLDLSLARQHG